MNNSHIALYRKYRPQKFSDVLGQDHIVKVLEGAIKLGNTSHAYLFVGGRGTGKTSLARIVARELGSTDNDIYEIDAASNNGVDSIRELGESVRTLPFDSKYKVYILDEAHMLSKAAANAFLKTLEEPPAHVVFMLATTDPEKLPDTIISRCQVFTLKKPNDSILKGLILDVSQKEGYTLDSAGAELIALLGDSSFRDTLGILEKAISFSKDKELSCEEIERVTGAPGATLVNGFITALVSKDIEKGFSVIRTASEQNIDMKIYTKLVLYKLRSILLLRLAPDMKKDLMATEGDMMFFEEILKTKSEFLNSRTLSILLESYQNLSYAFIPELPLELALVKILEGNK